MCHFVDFLTTLTTLNLPYFCLTVAGTEGSLKEEEFVLVDDEGLFDVDEIDESELARPTVVLPNKADVNATAIENQKQIKTGLEEIRHEITGENEDDLDEFVFVK